MKSLHEIFKYLAFMIFVMQRELSISSTEILFEEQQSLI
jgi:hypothetical protein